MSGGQEGTRWPGQVHGAPYTWGSLPDAPEHEAPGASFTWGPSRRDPRPEVRYATWGRRGAGFLVDAILMAAAPVAFFWAFAISLPQTSNPDPPMSAVSWVFFWCLLASFLLFVLYPVWFIGRSGQTPGMQQLDIRLFQIDGEGNLTEPSWWRAWGRAVMAFACWLLAIAWLLDYLWPLGDRRHQCIHDKAARTVAVDLRHEGWSGSAG